MRPLHPAEPPYPEPISVSYKAFPSFLGPYFSPPHHAIKVFRLALGMALGDRHSHGHAAADEN